MFVTLILFIRKCLTVENNFLKILYTYEEILSRVQDLAKEINAYYADKGEVLVVPVLDGSIVFAGHIIPLLDFDLHVRCTKITSYYETKVSTGKPKMLISIDMSLVKNKTILILEDLIDRGYTLDMFKKYLLDLGAKDVKICVLFNKQIAAANQRVVNPDWNGFLIPDEWVAGFGIDSESKFRNFKNFGIVKHNSKN